MQVTTGHQEATNERNSVSTEPVLTVATVSAAVVAAAGLFHVVLDLNAITAIAVVVVPFLGALIARSKVTPVA